MKIVVTHTGASLSSRLLQRGLRLGALLLLSCATNATTLYVDPLHHKPRGNAYESISQALSHLNAGDKLVIGNGTYRESIDLRLSHLGIAASQRATRIEAAPGAHPLIKGSDIVEGWTRSDDNVFAKKEWTVNSQQVFVDGRALQQIGGLIFGDFPLNSHHRFASLHRSQGGIWPGRQGNGIADLVDESFYYDSSAKILYVKTSTDITRGHSVEVSTRPYVVIGTSINRLELRGLAFAHANTTAVSQSGAISLMGNHLLLDHIEVEHTDGAGIDITGDHNTVSHSSANYCGIVGMKVRGSDAHLIDNETDFNNTRGFNKWWEAGGAKFVGAGGLQNSEVSGHRAYQNNGDGLWFDWHNDNNRIHNSIVAYNAGMGIHYEASNQAQIYDNYVIGNLQRGIYLPNSSHSVIAHNLVAANGMEGIVIVDERHAAAQGIEQLIPRGNRVVANVVAWNGKAALVLPPAMDDTRSDSNVFVDKTAPTMSVGWPSREQPLVRGLDAWRARSGQDSRSRWSQAELPLDLRKQIDSRHPLTTNNRSAWDWDWVANATSTLHTLSIADVDSAISRPGSPPGPAP